MRERRSRNTPRRFVVCIDSFGCEASLEVHKVYAVVPDPDAAQNGDLRIIDESGEDYLYPAGRFSEIALPDALECSLLRKVS